mgnify:CR=1 FL=1
MPTISQFMDLKERISRVVTFGMYDRMTTPKLPNNVDHYVAAGNPGKTFSEYPASLVIPETFTMGRKQCSRQDYTLYTVSGSSMLPEGIYSGYELLTRRVNDCREIRLGDFITISVDRQYYKFRHHGKNPHFVRKLRKAICHVEEGMTVQQLYEMLKGTFAEPFEQKEKKDLRESLEEARSYYGNTPLFLSVTYHDGDIHYSFHPTENICCRVEGVACLENDKLTFKLSAELAA